MYRQLIFSFSLATACAVGLSAQPKIITLSPNSQIQAGNPTNQSLTAVSAASSKLPVQEAKLTIDNLPSGTRYGSSVALSEGTVVVGVPSLDMVYVYVRSGTTWSLEAELMAEGFPFTTFDRFGESVAISGESIVVGAPGDGNELPGGTFADPSNMGSAYVFVRTGTTWSQQTRLTAEYTTRQDANFGRKVAIDGNTIVIGAPNGRATLDLPSSGEAFVFVRDGSTWSRHGRLTATNPARSDLFGDGIALSGDTIVVGAKGDDEAESDAGAAYVFLKSGTSWTIQAKLTADLSRVSRTPS